MSAPAPARHPNERRFEEFFIRDSYVTLKNYLYNYLERKRAIGRRLAQAPHGLVLEVGSGLSPIVTDRDDVIYSELSFRAMQALRRIQKRGRFVVADGTQLPFADGAIDQVVCSEVLEHVENDQVAITELSRVLRPGGTAYITVPHKQAYFAADDRYVRHFRRYEVSDMQRKLERGGLHLERTQKVLGPLEKATMWTLVVALSAVERVTRRSEKPAESSGSLAGKALRGVLRPMFKYTHRAYALLARADAAVMPQSLAAVILFEAEKPGDGTRNEG
jgi:SAM-dependent methyltransferase